MKKMLLLLTAVVLLLAVFAACRDGGADVTPTPAPTPAPAPPAPAPTPAPTPTPAPAPDPAPAAEYDFARVTWFFNDGMIPVPPDNYLALRAYEQINVEWVPVNPDTTDFEAVLFNFIAAGEQLDVIHSWPALQMTLARDGVIQPVCHWLNENYLYNVIRVAGMWDETLLTSLRHADGLIYGIPSVRQHFLPDTADWIRADWLEYVGMDIPTTYAELTEVLRAFAAGNPNGDNIAFFPHMVNELWGLGHIFQAHAAANQWHWAEDGYLELGHLSPRVVPLVEMLAEWFEEGLINQDFMTTAHRDIGERIRSGLVGYYRGWSGFGDEVAMQEIYPNARWIPILPLRSEHFSVGYTDYARRVHFTHKQYAIHINARDPYGIFRLMNFMTHDTATSTEPGQMTFEGSYWYAFGERGHHWDVINGFWVGPGGPGTWEDPVMQAAAERFATVHETDRWAGWAARRFLNRFDTRFMGIDPLGQAWFRWRQENLFDAGLTGCQMPASERLRSEVTPIALGDEDFIAFWNLISDWSTAGAFAERFGYLAIMGMGDPQTLFDSWLDFANAQGYQEMRRRMTQHILDNPF